MRWVHALGAAVAATALVGTTAKAVLSVSLVPVAVDATSAATIGGGQPVRTFDLQVTQTATEKFNVANLQVTLGSAAGTSGNLAGYFYASPGQTTGVNPNVTGNSNTLDKFGTYVNTPAFTANPVSSTYGTDLNITGSADWPAGPGSTTAVVPTIAGNSNSGNQTLNIVWGDSQSASASNTSTAGTYTIAQLTIVGNTGAFVRGYFGENISNAAQFLPSNAGGSLVLPQGAMVIGPLGDTNNDGAVNFTDFVNVKNNFNLATGGDTNGDGVVNFTDFVNVKNNFNNSLTPPASGLALGSLVPEPTSLALLGFAGLVGASRRRRGI